MRPGLLRHPAQTPSLTVRPEPTLWKRLVKTISETVEF